MSSPRSCKGSCTIDASFYCPGYLLAVVVVMV
jgi:hypothetical protein